MKIIKDKIDIGKLETTPLDLSKLSNVVKNDVFKKNEYNELMLLLLILTIQSEEPFNTKINEIEKQNKTKQKLLTMIIVISILLYYYARI